MSWSRCSAGAATACSTTVGPSCRHAGPLASAASAPGCGFDGLGGADGRPCNSATTSAVDDGRAGRSRRSPRGALDHHPRTPAIRSGCSRSGSLGARRGSTPSSSPSWGTRAPPPASSSRDRHPLAAGPRGRAVRPLDPGRDRVRLCPGRAVRYRSSSTARAIAGSTRSAPVVSSAPGSGRCCSTPTSTWHRAWTRSATSRCRRRHGRALRVSTRPDRVRHQARARRDRSEGFAPAREFLYAQRVQTPFEVYTDWLAVGHVDEISFIPGGSGDGFRVLRGLAARLRALFERLARDGMGDATLWRGQRLGQRSSAEETVEELLAKDDLWAFNDRLRGAHPDGRGATAGGARRWTTGDIVPIPVAFEDAR